MELGQSPVGVGDLKLLLEYFGDDPQHIAFLLDLGRNTKARGRWSGYRSIFPEWFRVYFDLEQDASDIKLTEAEVISTHTGSRAAVAKATAHASRWRTAKAGSASATPNSARSARCSR
jgi:hypothetical protein